MSIFGQHQFTKGVNRRTPIERTSPDSFFKLKNCRINKRGDTGFIVPIEGIETVATMSEYSNEYIIDSIIYGEFYLVLARKMADLKLYVKVYYKGVTTTPYAELLVDSTISTDKSGELILLDNNILISPYNKYLVYENQTWYIADFVSTTPIVSSEDYSVNELAYGTLDLTSVTTYPLTSPITIIISKGSDRPYMVETIENQTYGDGSELVDVIVNAISNEDESYPNTSFDIDTLGLSLSDEYIIYCHDPITNEIVYTTTSAARYADSEAVAVEIVSKFNTFTTKTDKLQLTNSGSVLIFESLIPGNDYAGSYLGIVNTPGTFVQYLTLPRVFEQVVFTDFLNRFDIIADGFSILVRAKNIGQEFENWSLNVVSNSVDYLGSLTTKSDKVVGLLKSNTNYWYAARYRYLDGHRTRLSVPVKIDTNSGRTKAILNIETDVNYNNSVADIEIYRKEEDSDWYMIDVIAGIEEGTTTYQYVDYGESDKQPLVVNEYIWDQEHQTQAIVRDRVVRGNLKFVEKKLEFEKRWFTVEQDSISSFGNVPVNTNVDIYVKPRFIDGTDGFHQKIGETLAIMDIDKTIKINQTAVINNENIKQLSYYAKYSPIGLSEGSGIQFSSVELANQYIPTIGTHNKSSDLQNKPATPKLFLGFRYVYAVLHGSGVTGLYAWCGYDDGTENSGWGQSNSASDIFFTDNDRIRRRLVKISDFLPAENNINVDYFGISLPYKLISGTSNTTSTSDDAVIYSVYELSFYEGLKSSIDAGQINIRLNTLNVSNVSNVILDSEILGSIAKVVGIEDKSLEENVNEQTGFLNVNRTHYTKNSNTWFWEGLNVPYDSRVYLLLDDTSVFSKFTNKNINKNTLKQTDNLLNTTAIDNFKDNNNPANMIFELYGLQIIEDYKNSSVDTFTTHQFGDDRNDTYNVYSYPNLKIIQYSNVSQDSPPFFIGSNKNEIGEITIDTYGYKRFDNAGVVYWTLNKSNIYETLLEESDIKQFTSDYPNQIIWSDPYIPSSYASQFRSFRYENFLNIPSNYGDIVSIKTIGGRLYVFCEKAVRQINVGEVVTQQSGGNQLIVNSTTFLNDGFWILENIQDIKAKSIKIYNNSIIFGDGVDIWLLGDGLKNISDGRITLDGIKSWVGVVDPKYKEYIVTDGINTWSYSFELGEWFGSHGYKYLAGSEYGSELYGIIDTTPIISPNVVKHNSGDLDTDTYGEVEIESVAYFADPNITTTWRKFYIEASPDNETVISNPYTYNSVDVPDDFDQAEFSYSSVFGYWTPKDLYAYTTPYGTHPRSGVFKKNGLFHVGIAPMPYEDLDVLLTDGTNTLGLSAAAPTDNLKLTEDTTINKNARYMYWRIRHKNINPALVIKSVKFEGLPKERR